MGLSRGALMGSDLSFVKGSYDVAHFAIHHPPRLSPRGPVSRVQPIAQPNAARIASPAGAGCASNDAPQRRVPRGGLADSVNVFATLAFEAVRPIKSAAKIALDIDEFGDLAVADYVARGISGRRAGTTPHIGWPAGTG